jgi:hypothetical protein
VVTGGVDPPVFVFSFPLEGSTETAPAGWIKNPPSKPKTKAATTPPAKIFFGKDIDILSNMLCIKFILPLV